MVGLGGHDGPEGRVLLHRLVQWFSSGMLGLGALCAAVLLAVALLGGARPTWWRDSASDSERRALAGAVDNGAWTAVTQVRPMSGGSGGNQGLASEPWAVSLTSEGATAWLNEKLPRWLQAQGHAARVPDGAELQAAFAEGVVRVGVRMQDEERFVSLELRPRIDRDGLWLTASTASVGRLDVPVSMLLGESPGRGGVADILTGRTPALSAAVFKLPDGRRVRLMKFEVVDERLVLTMRTEAGK
jgi:hypothetical protein